MQEEMRMQQEINLKRMVSFSVAILLVLTIFTALYTPQALATVSISQVSPSQGPVGTVVTLTGQITTENGSYKIFLGIKEVKSGNASQTSVSTTFIVPNATSGEHLIVLKDVTTGENYTATTKFTVQTTYILKVLTPPSPNQVQEGDNVTIITAFTGGSATTLVNLTVTDPDNVVHTATNFSIPLLQDGYGEANLTYPSILFDQNPHTFYVGTHRIAMKIAGTTMATGNFVVGLTNATEYYRFQTVSIQAANYTTSDFLTVRMTYKNDTVELTSSNASGPLGIITASWKIPANASLGAYKVELETTKPLSFEKPVTETQNFTVITKSFKCEVRTLNIDDEPVEGVLIEANNMTANAVQTNTTNASGVVLLSLKATNYTFKAFWNASDGPKALVGETSWLSIGATPGDRVGAHAINITCSLVHIKVAVEDTDGEAVPFVELRVNFTYTSRLDVVITPTPLSSETDLTGVAIFHNVYTNIKYTIKASRYDNVFATVTANLTSTSWFNMTIPTYQLIINVFDREGEALQDARVEIYEVDIGPSGLIGPKNTDTEGKVTFNVTFGEYFLDIYKNDLLVNHTTVLLTNQPTTFSVHCKLYSLTLDVNVVDFFGMGMPNANVTIEREGKTLQSSNTESDGVARFTDLVGGNFRILVYIGEKPYEITTLYLQEPTAITVKVGSLVSLGGYMVDTSIFLIVILVVVLIVLFLGVFLYRRFRMGQKKE
jgi:hypothetical protein